jgi:uncharacterized protein YbjT (DUF2867 family)
LAYGWSPSPWCFSLSADTPWPRCGSRKGLDWGMKNIFVLGGTGFVGTHVCEKLARQGHHITVATRRRNNARHLGHLPTLTVLEMDVHNPAALSAAMAGHDVVLNLVAILHGSEAAFTRVHVDLVRTVIAACHAAGVPRLVHISALGAQPQQANAAPSRYLRSKSAGEALLQASSLSVAILRPSVIFGAQDKFLNVFASLQRIFPVIPLAAAHAKFQPVWVQDVAQALVLLLQAPATPLRVDVWEACGPGVFSLGELVRLAGQCAGVGGGRGRLVVPLPHWMGWLQAAAMECLPGEPLMSRDNLDSMSQDNIATPGAPGLQSLGLQAAALEPIARAYLSPAPKMYH